MKHAQFKYQLVGYKCRNVLLIEDTKALFDTCNTVSNDMPFVIEHIELVERLKAEDYIILIKDTTLTWDGWNARTQEFTRIGRLDWTKAFTVYNFMQLEPQHA